MLTVNSVQRLKELVVEDVSDGWVREAAGDE